MSFILCIQNYKLKINLPESPLLTVGPRKTALTERSGLAGINLGPSKDVMRCSCRRSDDLALGFAV